MSRVFDVVIVGGGIVGLSTALALTRRDPSTTILVLEKEYDWARHQTGHNSGVIHSGIYYVPGSFKARFCRDGRESMVAFCREHGIAHEICGKVIVATETEEIPRLEKLYRRGLQNGLRVDRIGASELREIEPHVRGLKAVRVHDAGIVDYKAVCRKFVELLREHGCELRTGHEVKHVVVTGSRVEVEAGGERFLAKRLVNCAGLHSDRVATYAGARTDLKIVPFRGEYFELREDRRGLVKHLIYPVPDPNFPFLGVHFTRMIGGKVEAGPNAVLALAREGYRKTDVSIADLAEILRFPGFWTLSRKYWREGFQELWRSMSKAAFVRSLQRLIPEVRSEDLVSAPAGIRAQALRANGSLVDDFAIVEEGRCLHVCNSPSPAATASIEIGKYVAALVIPEADAPHVQPLSRAG